MRKILNNKTTAASVEKIIANVKASLSVEGLVVTENETGVIKSYLEGAYSEKEVLRIIKNS